MSKELRDFIAVAGARARWRRTSIYAPELWGPAMSEYLRKRSAYKRLYGVFLSFPEEP